MSDFAFKQIRESLGGKVKILISGSAPISPEVLLFMRVCAGCHVLEGYGATETGGASSCQIPGETTVGNVGPPFMCAMYKLLDVPEMGLDAKRDNRGEICVSGNNIFKGYFKDEEKTKEALVDGWYRTGDIGSWETVISLFSFLIQPFIESDSTLIQLKYDFLNFEFSTQI